LRDGARGPNLTAMNNFLALLLVLVTVLGAAVYYRAASPKSQELGRLTYGAGMLVILLCLGWVVRGVFGR
jgi:hypothetical protein